MLGRDYANPLLYIRVCALATGYKGKPRARPLYFSLSLSLGIFLTHIVIRGRWLLPVYSVVFSTCLCGAVSFVAPFSGMSSRVFDESDDFTLAFEKRRKTRFELCRENGCELFGGLSIFLILTSRLMQRAFAFVRGSLIKKVAEC